MWEHRSHSDERLGLWTTGSAGRAGEEEAELLRPLDTAALEAAATETGAIVVAEEHLAHSGLGSMCAQALARTVPVPMEFVAVDDRYGESGKWFEVLEMVGLTSDAIAAAARKVVGRKG